MLSPVYRAVTAARRWWWTAGPGEPRRSGIPVIVVGNITVGGTGKTPLVILIVETLSESGFTPAVVSRGYGSSAGRGPRPVTASSDPGEVGDEPLLIQRRTGVRVFVGSDRSACVAAAASAGCDVVVSDDGLQHHAMHRDLEIIVIDGIRGLGNGRMLPAGPLREPATRLDRADWVVSTGGGERGAVMTLVPGDLVLLRRPGVRCPLSELSDRTVHAITGIGHPERFFSSLRQAGLTVKERAFPDHHAFQKADLEELQQATVVMTEKDAVKCEAFAGEDWWMLPINAKLDAKVIESLAESVKGLRQ